MWKNIFLESCILSALIFGGFYINANHLKEELYENEEKASYLNQVHISGLKFSQKSGIHISGEKLKNTKHLSGASFSASPPE